MAAPAASPAALPRVPRLLSFRNSWRLSADPIPYITGYLDTYGDTVGMYLGGVRPTLLTRDPGLIQHILQKNHRNYPKSSLTGGLARYLGHGLLTAEGSYWLQQRRLIQPGFHRQRLAGLTQLMLDAIEECLAPVAAAARQQGGATEVPVHELMTTVAFRIITRSVFSTGMSEAELQRLAGLLTELQAFYIRTMRQPYLRPWMHLRGQFQHHDALAAELRELVRRYVRRRQQQPADAHAPDDLLQMLLDVRYEDSGQPMTEDQVLDEAIILLVAGHETSANGLAWLWYLLARRPEEVARLRAEMQQVLGPGQPPSFPDLPRLPYAQQVVQETLRLYPPVWVLDRQAAHDDEYNGLPLPKGTLISAYIYGMHHNPAHWDDPETFRPARFGAEPGRERPAYAYLPFGGGPRQCIGNQFALTEMQLVLLEVLRRFEVRWVEQPPVTMRPLISLRPRQDFRLGLHLL